MARSRAVVLAIDPDPTGGTWVLLDEAGSLLGHQRNTPIGELRHVINGFDQHEVRTVVIEDVAAYRDLGATTLQTVKSIGEVRGWCSIRGREYHEMLRPTVKASLCPGVRYPKDKHVRAALIDLYGPTKGEAVGLKASPGPLYGIAADEWAALALGVVWLSKSGLGPLAERDGIEGAA